MEFWKTYRDDRKKCEPFGIIWISVRIGHKMCFHLQDTTLDRHTLLILTLHKQFEIFLDCLKMRNNVFNSCRSDLHNGQEPLSIIIFTKLFVRFLYVLGLFCGLCCFTFCPRWGVVVSVFTRDRHTCNALPSIGLFKVKIPDWQCWIGSPADWCLGLAWMVSCALGLFLRICSS